MLNSYSVSLNSHTNFRDLPQQRFVLDLIVSRCLCAQQNCVTTGGRSCISNGCKSKCDLGLPMRTWRSITRICHFFPELVLAIIKWWSYIMRNGQNCLETAAQINDQSGIYVGICCWFSDWWTSNCSRLWKANIYMAWFRKNPCRANYQPIHNARTICNFQLLKCLFFVASSNQT